MSKKSVVVSGMGLALSMLINANQVRREMGITNEQFHILATEAGHEHWRRLFEGIAVSYENNYKTYKITVNNNKSLDQMIEGNYDCVDHKVISLLEQFPVSENGQKKDVRITLVHRDKRETIQCLIDEVSVQYRPVTYNELLELGINLPELQGEFPIIAPETVDGQSVLYLSGRGNKRSLCLRRSNHEWQPFCRFAFVEKN